MKFYPRILLAELMGLPAADCLRHGDVWLCGSFVAGAAFVLAASRLFGETAAPEAADEVGFRSGGAQESGVIAIGHRRKAWFGPTTGTLIGRALTNGAIAVGQPRSRG